MVLGNDTTAGDTQDHDKSTQSSYSQQQSHCSVTRSIASNDPIISIWQLASRAANALLVPFVTRGGREGSSSCP
jgi:hypothetical protein